MVLYHTTFKSRLDSIMEIGLRPNYIPNNWPDGGMARSKGKTFLCWPSRRRTWEDILSYDLSSRHAEELVCVRAVIDREWVRPDNFVNDWGYKEYYGDFWTRKIIRPEQLRVVPLVTPRISQAA